MWTDLSAGILEGWGAVRNDHNPAIFRLEDLHCSSEGVSLGSAVDVDIEQHGDDFAVEGPRDEILKLKALFQESFLCKKADIISMHPDDNKEGWFLHKRIWCDETGWHENLTRDT